MKGGNTMNWAACIWLALAIVFLIVEAACPIHLVSIWFAAGSLIAMFATMLGAQLWLQVTLFLVVSGGLLVCLWPFVRKFLKSRAYRILCRITILQYPSVFKTEVFQNPFNIRDILIATNMTPFRVLILSYANDQCMLFLRGKHA